MEVFVAHKNDLINRFDPTYILFKLSFEINSNFELVEIGDLLVESPQYGANERAIDGNPDIDYRYIRITDIDEFGNLKNIEFKTAEHIEEKYKLKPDDILFARSGATAGKCFIYTDSMPRSIFAGYLIRFVFDKTKVFPKYVFFICQLEYYKTWVTSIQRPAGQPNINSNEFKSFKLPLPPISIQEKIIQIMDETYTKKKQNEEEAEKLLNSYTELINEFVDIDLNLSSQRIIFTIHFSELEGALNPERYANQISLDSNYSWIQIQNIGDVIRKTFAPSRTNPENDYGLIRIDDLESNPQNAVIRKVKGKDINGIILRVQKDDILIARLGPTLENKKTILTPEYDKHLIASNEFICLRCHENVNPVFVLVLLKTDFYKNLMIQKSRGATPSRRRLSHEDFAELPFPDIDKSIQDEIANKFIVNVNRAKQLKREAIEALEQAKKEVEKILFEQPQ